MCSHPPPFQNYTATMEFVSSFESLCPTQNSVRRLRTSASFTAFIAKWSLPVYFQIRFSVAMFRNVANTVCACEKVRVSVCVCIPVCVCVRSEREYVYVCMCEREGVSLCICLFVKVFFLQVSRYCRNTGKLSFTHRHSRYKTLLTVQYTYCTDRELPLCIYVCNCQCVYTLLYSVGDI